MRRRRLLLYAGLLVAVSTAQATTTDPGFERYQVILTRMPFGDVPLEAEPEAEVVPAAESFAKDLRMCSITHPEGREAKVGLVDAKTQKSFMLRVGETNEDGIELVSADLEEEEAVLQKGTEIALVKLGGSTASPLSSQQLAARKPTPTNQASSYEDRRRQRRVDRLKKDENRKALEEARKKLATPPVQEFSPEVMRENLRKYNMQAIRDGLPALPIELSPEEDAQLVSEGVLAPAEGQVIPPPPLFANPPPTAPAAQDFSTLLGDLPLEQMSNDELILLEGLMNP